LIKNLHQKHKWARINLSIGNQLKGKLYSM